MLRASSPQCATTSGLPAITLSPIAPSRDVKDLSGASNSSLLFVDTSDDSLHDATAVTTPTDSFNDSTQGDMEFMDITTESDGCSAASSSAPIMFHNSIVHTCCQNRCLAAFSLLEVERCRNHFCKKNRLQQQQYMLDIFMASSTQENKQKEHFLHLSGRSVCKRSFMSILGISEKRLRKVLYLHTSGVLTVVKVQRVYNKSEKHVIAKSWMKRYFERIGDKMPHIQQIHLPHFLSKKVVYDFMCTELQQQGLFKGDTISLSRFYSIWATDFSSCVIPKVPR